jgi:hypothetical protein
LCVCLLPCTPDAQRVIHGTILNPLSKEMLAGTIRDGAHVKV